MILSRSIHYVATAVLTLFSTAAMAAQVKLQLDDYVAQNGSVTIS